MDPVIGLWIASLLGAACFAAAGFFYARAKTPRPIPASLRETVPAPSPAAEPVRAEDRDTPPDAVGQAEAVSAAVAEAEEKARRQLETLREELRIELLARTEAEKRASDLASRLLSSGQQVTALRAKISLAEEAKRSGQHAAVRNPTLPPPRVSERPPAGARMQSLAPGLFAEIEELRREVSRLTTENKLLRQSNRRE
jgi:hypothetical protein